MMTLDTEALDLIFNDAHTYTQFEDKPVSDAVLQQVFELAEMGPTSANCLPMRVLFIKSDAAKAKLKPTLLPGNVDKTMKAPVCAVIAQDMEFYNNLPRTFPQTDAKSWFVGKDEYIQSTAFRNSSMQGAYFIIAARSMGLDCGPMSGFNNTKLDEIFFSGTSWKSNFLINLGYGKADSYHARNPRLSFEEACEIV